MTWIYNKLAELNNDELYLIDLLTYDLTIEKMSYILHLNEDQIRGRIKYISGKVGLGVGMLITTYLDWVNEPEELIISRGSLEYKANEEETQYE